MAEARHGYLTTAEGIHIPYQWSYANAAARTGAVGFAASDVGKLARQTDDNSIWMLTATTPTWLLVGSGLLGDLGEILFHTDDLLLLDFQRWLKNPGDANSQLIGSRLEQIVHTGALRYVPGRFPGKQALAVEPAGTNYAKNPVHGVNATDDWTLTNGARARVTTRAKVGTACCRLTAGAAVDATQETTTGCLVANNDHVTMYAWVYREDNSGCNVILQDATTPAARDTVAATKIDAWEYIKVTWQNTTGGAVTCKLQIVNTEGDGASNIWFDAVQIENDQAYATSLIHGDVGPGYDWTGAPHNSTSTRTRTEINLDDQAGLVSTNDTLTFATWVQMPHDADDTNWPDNRLMNTYFDADNYVFSFFDGASDAFRVFVKSGGTLIFFDGAVQTFEAGDWIHVVFTLDYNGYAYSYVNGTKDASADISALASPSVTQWNVGSKFNATLECGFAFDEFAVFDRVLTAAEIATMYALQRPLVDEGALETRPTVLGVSAGYWPMVSVACTHTGDTDYAEAETAAGTMESRIAFAGVWANSQIQFEAILKNSDAGAADDANAKLQYYHTASAAWVDVTDSIIAITANTSTPNRVRSVALALPLQEYEYRVVIATPDDAAETVTCYKAGLVISPGGSTIL